MHWSGTGDGRVGACRKGEVREFEAPEKRLPIFEGEVQWVGRRIGGSVLIMRRLGRSVVL